MLIKKKTLHEDIADTLRKLIITGKLKEGEKVNENELCASMGTSKTPLREALRVLSVEGLIKLVPNRGAYVRKPTLEQIKEMFDVMSVLEGLSAWTAAEKLTDADLLNLKKIHKNLKESCKDKNQKKYLHYNSQFHTLLLEVAGNKALNQIINILRKQVALYRSTSLALPKRMAKSFEEHAELLEALKKRDPEKAEKIMRMHLKNQYIALLKISEE